MFYPSFWMTGENAEEIGGLDPSSFINILGFIFLVGIKALPKRLLLLLEMLDSGELLITVCALLLPLD